MLEIQPDGYLDAIETAGTWGGTVDSPPRDWDEIVDIVFAAGDDDARGYGFAELRPSNIRGLVWEDVDEDEKTLRSWANSVYAAINELGQL